MPRGTTRSKNALAEPDPVRTGSLRSRAKNRGAAVGGEGSDAATGTASTDKPAATSASSTEEKAKPSNPVDMVKLALQQRWIVLGLASGGFAALNGVFAKLTTTSLTTSLATSISGALNLPPALATLLEYAVRATFFGLNLLSNGIMWALFTRALTAHSSATKVSLVNVSANFMLTAVLGALIFSESLPPLWWGGAALLVGGNLVIGRRDGAEEKRGGGGGGGGGGEGRDSFDDAALEGSGRRGMSMEMEDAKGEERAGLLAGDEEGISPDGEDL